jgi:hypothetical protein
MPGKEEKGISPEGTAESNPSNNVRQIRSGVSSTTSKIPPERSAADDAPSDYSIVPSGLRPFRIANPALKHARVVPGYFQLSLTG